MKVSFVPTSKFCTTLKVNQIQSESNCNAEGSKYSFPFNVNIFLVNSIDTI